MPNEVYGEIASSIARFAEHDAEYATPIEGLYFNRRSSPTQPIHTAQWPCFALVAQGAKSLVIGDETYRYGVGDFLLVSLDVPVASRVTEASRDKPHLGLGMAIRPESIKALFARVTVPRPASGPEPVRAVSVNAADPELLDAVLRLVKLLDKPQDIPAMAPLIEQEILYRLLAGPLGSRLLQIATIDSPSSKIAKAMAWLRENYTRPFSLEALAELAGMSVSSLGHHFKAITSMSPVQYQKQLRLHEARRLMLVEKFEAGAAGYAVGYQSPSQFSREYTRLYGLSPLRDVSSGVQRAAARPIAAANPATGTATAPIR